MLCLVVVDPVRAFTDVDGRIGRVHGAEEFVPIRTTVDRLAAHVDRHVGPQIWVRSVYEPGQFSGGDLTSPMAHLCDDPYGEDCAWDERLHPAPSATVVTKAQTDATTCEAFVDAIDAIAPSIDGVVVTGFWLTACVETTAIGCARLLRDRNVPVIVPLSLAAARAGHYRPSAAGPSMAEETIERLRSAGVDVRPESITS